MSSLYPPGPSTDTYYLNPEFVWEKTYQHFYDSTTGFVYDIFVQAYVYNDKYYHWNDHEQNYVEIADPYVYAYKDVFGDNPVNQRNFCVVVVLFSFFLFLSKKNTVSFPQI